MSIASSDALFERIYAALPPDTDDSIRSLFASKHPFTPADAENIMSELFVLPTSPSAREEVRKHLGQNFTTFASFRKGFAYASYHSLSATAPSEGEGIEMVEEGARRLRGALDRAVSKAEKLTPKKPRRSSLLLSPSLTTEFFTPRENPTLLQEEQTPQKAARREGDSMKGVLRASPELWYTPLPFAGTKVLEPNCEGAANKISESLREDGGLRNEELKIDGKENQDQNGARACRLSHMELVTGAECGDVFCLGDELNNEMNRVERLFPDDESECESLSAVCNALSLSISNTGQDVIGRLDSNSHAQIAANDYQENDHAMRSVVPSERHNLPGSQEMSQEDVSRAVVLAPDQISPATVQVRVHSKAFTRENTVSRATWLLRMDGSVTAQDGISHRSLNLSSLVEVDEQSQVPRLPKDAEASMHNKSTDEVRCIGPFHNAKALPQDEYNDSCEHTCPARAEGPLGATGETTEECEESELSLPYMCPMACQNDNAKLSNLKCVRSKIPTVQISEEASVGRLEASKDIVNPELTIPTNAHNGLLTVRVEDGYPPDAIELGEASRQEDINTEQVESTCDGRAKSASSVVKSFRENRRQADDNRNYGIGKPHPTCDARINNIEPQIKSCDSTRSVQVQKMGRDDKKLNHEGRLNCAEELAQFGQYQDHDISNDSAYDYQPSACANDSCDFGQVEKTASRQSFMHDVTSNISAGTLTTEACGHIETECSRETETFEDDSIYMSPTPIQTSGAIIVDELCTREGKIMCVKDYCGDGTTVATAESTRFPITCLIETKKTTSNNDQAIEEIPREWDVDDALDYQEAVDQAARTQHNDALNETKGARNSGPDGVSETCEFSIVRDIAMKNTSGSLTTLCAPTPPSSGWPAFCPATPPSEAVKRSARSNHQQNSPPSEFQSPILAMPQSRVNESSRELLFSSSSGSIAGEHGSTVSLDTRDSLAAAVHKYVKNAQQVAEMSVRVEVESEESDVTPEGFGQVRKLKPSRYTFTAAGEEVQEAPEELMGSAVSARTLSGRRSNVSGGNNDVLEAVRECLEICREVRMELGVRKRRRRVELSMWLIGILALSVGVWMRRRGVVSFVEVML